MSLFSRSSQDDAQGRMHSADSHISDQTPSSLPYDGMRPAYTPGTSGKHSRASRASRRAQKQVMQQKAAFDARSQSANYSAGFGAGIDPDGYEAFAASYAPAEASSRKKSRIWGVIFWIALFVCIASLGALAYIGFTYWHADKTYKDIAQLAFDEPANEATIALGDMSVDWDYLRSVNPDIVGWVYMPGTPINYPIVQTDNDETYLSKSFTGETGFAARGGAIFMEAANDPNLADDNNLIYGHNMKDGSMFAYISNHLENQDEFDSHRTVYLLTPRMNYRFTTFSLIITDGWDRLVQTSFKDDADKSQYIEDKISRSAIIPRDGMPAISDVTKMLALSTCDYNQNNGRAVLFTYETDRAIPHSADKGEAVNPDDVSAIADASKEAA